MRKIFGVLLIILAAFLSLAILMSTLPTLLDSSSKVKGSDASSLGYAIGTFIAFISMVAVNACLYFFGFKLLKKKKELVPIPSKDFPTSTHL
ncbi:hypothetical protein [Pedobacter chitinilyticus]|jgi:fructose-specific phosphotransferase system IIC component|uniref:Uncharacterized protein n=1 Tax=Pedobacter chitinilyticus TaxID=2233776 RepID=A0A443YV65_9SPHI|nr:hypothetical protein [Pedobacter chitinilyticus]RWU07743.1 hypothetical protein DPV69_12240 [Pedobacter chitinilyticus]